MKKVFTVLKRFILSAFILYGYNLIATSFNLVIPINIINIGLVGTLGVPALCALIFLKLIAF